MGSASSEACRSRGTALLLAATLSGCVLPEALEWIGEAGAPSTSSASSSSSSSTGAGGANTGGGSTSSTGGATSSTGGGGAASSAGGGGSTTGAGGSAPTAPWPDSPTEFCTNGTSGEPCVSALTGQDGQYRIAVPTYAVSTGVVTDDVTSLAWQDIGSPAGMSHAAALAYCPTQTTGGLVWRLPTYLELLSIADYGSPTQGIKPGVFVPSTYYWTSDLAFDPSKAWEMRADTGALNVLAVTQTFPRVRCVSGAAFTGTFASQVDGTILDERTGLAWGPDAGSGFTWANALAHCESYTSSTVDDFRLPSLKELATLVEPSSDPAYDTAVFGSLPLSPIFASSTPSVVNPDDYWVLDMGTGIPYPNWTIATFTARVRCVR